MLPRISTTLFWPRLMAVVAIVACSPLPPASAQTTTFTNATTEQLVLNPASVVTTSTVDSYLTQIIGQLQGGGILYDQSFPLPYSDPTVQVGQTSAILAITTAGGPGVVIGTPVLTDTSQTITGSTTTTTYTLASTDVAITTEVKFGPGAILIGPRTVCTGISALPGSTAPSCGVGTPVSYSLVDGETNFTTVTGTTYTVDQDTLIAQSLQLFEQYTITGTVQAVGGAHAAIPSALGDENERFAQRLLRDAIQVGTPAFDNGASPATQRSAAMGWFDGFGWTGSGNGDDRSGAGLEGGLGVNVSDQWRIGFGVSHGWINLDLDNAGGSANAELTEIGLYSRWRNDDFYVGLAGIAGFGSVDTDGLDTTASYDTTVFSVAGEAGYHVGFSGWDLTPNIGAQWTDVEMDAFTETGPFALASSGSGNSFGKGWLGLRAQRQFDALTLSGYARLMAYADDDISVPVAFVGSSTELVIEGADRDTFGGEAGLAANLQLGDATSAFATYDARFRDSSVIHAGMVGLQVSW